MEDLISIILPVYNSASFVEKTLDALCRQTYPHTEVLCIDDGSTDDSLAILRAYEARDARIRVFTQENSGPARARNVGLAHMRGKYLMFCDSDDWYEPNMCEVMLRTMREQDVDLVMCGAEIHQLVVNRMSQGKIAYGSKWPIGYHCFEDRLRSSVNVWLWNKIYKTDYIHAYGMDFPDGYEDDDVAFIYEYISVSASYFGLDKKLYHHVTRENSIMDNTYKKKAPEKKYDMIYALMHTRQFLIRNHLIDRRRRWFFERLQNQLHYVWRFLDTSAEKNKTLRMVQKLLLEESVDAIQECRILIHIHQGRFWLVRAILDDNYWVRKIRAWKSRFYALWQLNPFSLGYLIGEYRGYIRRSASQKGEIIMLLRMQQEQIEILRQKIEYFERK